jgi:hypothetical protein
MTDAKKESSSDEEGEDDDDDSSNESDEEDEEPAETPKVFLYMFESSCSISTCVSYI